VTADRVAEALRGGSCPPDHAFDRFLPVELQRVSNHYWTPLVVAKRAAEWFEDADVRTVVDIGSGAGKFCIAVAIASDCQFIGLEQRSKLVGAARTLARVFGVEDRVTFLEGAFGQVATPMADAYYLYNPFGEYMFGPREYFEGSRGHGVAQCARDIDAVKNLLRRAPLGTLVLTYNGFGGRVPASYRQIRADDNMPNALRLWQKSSCEPGVRLTLT
jgi:SAM-dependent methyltransferase